MNINKLHGEYNISKRTSPVKYIVLHYTEGSHKAGSAKKNCIYFGEGNRKSSAHYFIDDGGIWEYADPSTHYTWHCGDGHGKYGITNANSIGIEVCQDGDIPYTESEIRYLTELVLYLMTKFSVKEENIVRHYDASRKSCPKYYASRNDEWIKLRNKVAGKTANKWLLDNNGWIYFDSYGNITKSKWIKYKNVWYYMNQNGYMATNKWQKDSTGKWCYLGSDGKQVKSKWIQYKGGWYYIKSDGYMAVGKLSVGHTFDSSGKCTG